MEGKRWRGSPSTRPSPVGRPVGVGLRWESAMLRSGQDHTALLPKQKQQNQGRAAGGLVIMSMPSYLPTYPSLPLLYGLPYCGSPLLRTSMIILRHPPEPFPSMLTRAQNIDGWDGIGQTSFSGSGLVSARRPGHDLQRLQTVRPRSADAKGTAIAVLMCSEPRIVEGCPMSPSHSDPRPPTLLLLCISIQSPKRLDTTRAQKKAGTYI
ncbi:uncharacterized protein BDZ83DRAFT_305503 [Colletotrichum acutatum]|uniref:Uncharacterized protein n=1 Tax=Glomerella acutata TaxID=27357 RepID=A0AAD8UNJ5_GLOAC|nr:uncharacterized protein BDZ83DRAFT_305503 [Colletotrichum acutatum]KAK1725345.1 hypothetical protein BDZ83DRAFT_305503 [Colletotrichum acutatum]